ncbi:MAG: hypothetical protein ACLQMO_11750 [Acidobacteriaceae bacterium]
MASNFGCADARFPLASLDRRISPVGQLGYRDFDFGLLAGNSQVSPEILAASLTTCTQPESTTPETSRSICPVSSNKVIPNENPEN